MRRTPRIGSAPHREGRSLLTRDPSRLEAVASRSGDPFPTWCAAVEARHRAELSFQEIRRALQALSALYVERRGRLGSGSALDGAGKRAAFALFYGPLHFLVVREIVRALGAARGPMRALLDLGCGTGAPAAAWALERPRKPAVEGIDLSGWAVGEARWTLARFGLEARVHKGDASAARLPEPPAGILAAFTVNEMDDAGRGRLLPRLVDAGRSGCRVLVVEPIARRALPWWPAWAEAFRAAGGREDEWRFRVPLPPALALLDKAAGLDHRELTARSLWLG